METAHSLILNEEAFKKIEDHKKPVYVFEWLRSLDKLLVAAQKVNHTHQSFILVWVKENMAKIYFNLHQNFDKIDGYQSMSEKTGGAIDDTDSRIAWTPNTEAPGQLSVNTVLRWRYIPSV